MDEKIIELINAYAPGASEHARERRKKIDEDTQAYLDKYSLNVRYDHWLKMAFWRIQEAKAVLAGFEPLLMHKRDIPDNVKMGILLRLEPYSEALERAVGAYILDERARPIEYINWAQKNNFKVTEALAEFTKKPKSEPIEPQLVAPKEKPLGTRERETLLKLVIGMAVKGYRYNPKAAKNTAVSEIATDLEAMGIAVSDDTVRKWLNEASQHLDQEALESLT